MVERRHEPLDWPLPVFGLTGSIASGKSTLARLLAGLGAEVIDADRTAHRLMWKGRPVYRRVVAEFGRAILGPGGGIDRARLGARVFSRKASRRRLEAILHPAILASARRAIERIAVEHFAVVVFEAALLMESGFDRLMHDSIVVVAERRVQVERLVRLRRMGRAEADRRIRAQWSGGRKAGRARWVVENSGTQRELEIEASRLWKQLLSHRATRTLRRGFSGPAR
jgi:dephospho-CoA kinase